MRSKREGLKRGDEMPKSGKKVKSSPITGLDRPRGFQEIKAPRFRDNGREDGGKVVSLTHRPPLPLGNTPGTHLC